MKTKYNPYFNIFERSKEDSFLPQVMWHITDKCYLDCKTCFAKKRKTTLKDMPMSKVEEYLSCLKLLGVQKIDISGGEPLLYKLLPFLVCKCKEYGFYVTITTRGIGISENYDWLVNNWKLFSRVIVSLDGSNDSICDFYASYPNTMQKTLELCSDLKKNNCDNIRINTVINQQILSTDIIEEFVRLIRKILPREWCLIEPHPLNKKREFDNYTVEQKEFTEFELKSKKLLGKNTRTKVITRDKEMYSTYWTLQNDGIISQLSLGAGYDYTSLLCIENLDVIKKYIKKCLQKIPMNVEETEMNCIKMNSLTQNVNSALLLDEITDAITEPYSKENFSIDKSEECVPGTKGIITTASVIKFVAGVAKELTVAMIKTIALSAVKKIFTKKQADSVQILIEDNKVTIKSDADINIDIVIIVK